LLALQAALAEVGWEARRWQGDIVECADAAGKTHILGLANLYRRARRTERENWPALLGEFLRAVRGAEEADTLLKDLAAVADQLLLRVGPPMKAPRDAAPVWSEPLGETGLVVTMVVDYPDRMAYVTEDLVAGSGRPGSEWRDQARANLRGRTPADALKVMHEESGLLVAGVGDSYDSSRALLLDELLPATCPDGCFVALPGRDELLVLPVTARGLEYVHVIKVLAEKSYQTVPYAISEQVFWVRQGTWRTFPITVRNNAAAVQPPPEFGEILERLTPGEGEAGPAVAPPDGGASPG
jgi:hypothetical protein